MKRAILFILVLAASLAASAQVLYKLVDKNGKVTYAEKVPPGFDGQATRVDIDTNRNTATLPKLAPAPAEGSEGARRPSPSPSQQTAQRKERRVDDAKKKLEEAKAALTAAVENPGEGDVVRIGNAGGGARAVWSDEYKARVDGLEAKVKAAEQALADAEKSD